MRTNESNLTDMPLKLSNKDKEEVRKDRKLSSVEESKLFNDVMIAVNEEHKGSSSDNYEEVEWEIPVIIDEYNTPAFPVEVYTPIIRNMINAVADFTQTPPDLAAMVAIGVLSTVLSKKFVMEPKAGWKESLNTYTMPLMESSNRKTPVYLSMTEPIYSFENELIEEMKSKVKKRKVERTALEKRIEKLQNDFAKTKDPAIKEEIKDVVDELEQLPEFYLPSLLLDDVTPEIVVTRLKENNEKISIMSAEGDLLEKLKGKGTDQVKLDVFLKGYSGDPLRVDRVGRGTERLNKPLLTICISAQPSVIQSMPESLHDRGFIPRFLFAVPNDYVGYRDPNSPPIPQEIRNQYTALIKKLLNFKTKDPIILHFDEAAKMELVKFLAEVEMEFREGGVLHDRLKSWGGKLVGQLVRIAGLLHVSHHAETATSITEIPTTINIETLVSAFQLKNYFISHAEKAFGIMKQNPLLVDAQFILQKILNEKELVISRQTIWQKTRKRIEIAERLSRAFDVLESRYYIQRVWGGKSGRKEFIHVNPFLFQSTNLNPNSPNIFKIVGNTRVKEGKQDDLKAPNFPINNAEIQKKYKVVQEL